MTARRRTHTAARALAPALTLALVATAGCSEQTPTAADPAPPAASSPSEPDSSRTPAGTDTAGSGETVAAPAYFVADTPFGPRLVREFRQVEADNPGDELLALLSAGDVVDPDYSTLLPAGSARLVDGTDAIGVEIPADWAQRPDGMSKDEAALAIQQIVYSLQGLRQERLPVKFVRGDQSTAIFGIDQPDFDAADQLDTLALVNVTTPEEGASVADAFTASGVASSFEANVIWQIRDDADEPVLEGFATAEGWLDKLYPWEVVVDVSSLQPGTYSFVAMTDDPSGGEEGPGATEDSKTITVG